MTISTPKPLTALALTQLRLDVEAAMQKAGDSLGPVDRAFFDPLEDDEDCLRSSMVSSDLKTTSMRCVAERKPNFRQATRRKKNQPRTVTKR